MKKPETGTIVYGASDDLIEFDGEYFGEVGFYEASDDNPKGALVIVNDGTILCVAYGKPGNLAIWAISVLKAGELFERIDVCHDEDAKPYSDVAYFKPGVKKVWVAKQWEVAE